MLERESRETSMTIHVSKEFKRQAKVQAIMQRKTLREYLYDLILEDLQKGEKIVRKQ